MELWIRSQDKEKLLKVNDIATEMNMIYGYFDKNTEYEHLGTYATKKRALEVLDEIQDILKPKLKIVQTDDMSLPIINGEWVNSIREKMEFDTIQLSTYVYEMPKE